MNIKLRFSKGYSLLEMGVVLAIMGVVAMGMIPIEKAKMVDDRAAGIAQHEMTVAGGVNAYISSNYEALMSGTAITGFVASLTPTVNELKTKGYLAPTVSPTNEANTTWLVKVWKNPVGCVAPNCDINAIVYSSSGFRDTQNRPDSILAAAVASKISSQGIGMVSLDSNTAVLSGPMGTVTTANPVIGANAAAVTAMFTGYNSQGLSQFVRQGDTRNITLAGGLNVNGASGVTSTNLTALNAVSGVSGTFGTLTTSGQLNVGSVALNTIYNQASACSPNGLVGRMTDGSLMSCVSGVWALSSAKPCVHGSFVASTPGIYSLPKPTGDCIFTVTAVGGGASGSGVDTYNYWHTNAGLGGGASNTITSQVIPDGSASYTITVGAGGAMLSPIQWQNSYSQYSMGGVPGGNTSISSTLSGVMFSVTGGTANPKGVWNAFGQSKNFAPEDVGGNGGASAYGAGGIGGALPPNLQNSCNWGGDAPLTSYGAGGGGSSGKLGVYNWNGWHGCRGGNGAGGYISISW